MELPYGFRSLVCITLIDNLKRNSIISLIISCLINYLSDYLLFTFLFDALDFFCKFKAGIKYLSKLIDNEHSGSCAQVHSTLAGG
jgi:hypothetical protein